MRVDAIMGLPGDVSGEKRSPKANMSWGLPYFTTELCKNIVEQWHAQRPRKVKRWFTRDWVKVLFNLLSNEIEESLKVMSAADNEERLMALIENHLLLNQYQKWWLLFNCVEDVGQEIESYKGHEKLNANHLTEVGQDDDLHCILARALLRTLPSLALVSEWDWLAEPHDQLLPSPPLHLAAEQGKVGIFKVMLDQENHALGRDELLLKLTESLDHPHDTVFSVATRACQCEIVDILLNFDPRIAIGAKDDSAFDDLLIDLRAGRPKRDDAACVIRSILRLRSYFRTPENFSKVVATGHEELTLLMMDGPPTPCLLTESVAKTIIELDHWKIWELWTIKEEFKGLKMKGLLHHAVQHQRPQFVETILKENPSAIAELALVEEKPPIMAFPLWHNNHMINAKYDVVPRKGSDDEKEAIRKTIRELLVSAMISSQKMSKVSEIFLASKEKAGEVCFDLSRFDSKSFRVRKFADLLMNKPDDAGIMSFEPILRYADFPSLDLNSEVAWGDDLQRDHKEVFDILEWLKDKKNVKKIIELNVLDRLYNPHDETRIATWVEKLEVEILNWRCLDLSISVLEKLVTKDQIRELHLYASGKRAVISHWTSPHGVETLPNLERLYIHVIQDMMSPTGVENFDKDVKTMFESYEQQTSKKRKFDFRIKVEWWNRRSTVENMKDLNEVARTAVPKLLPFIDHYRSLLNVRKSMNQHTSPTKVALIDNGILNISPSDTVELNDSRGLWSRVKEGRSFVDQDYKASPWLFASDPHGTQMANLICAIDPNCDLYVAKVADGRFGIVPSRVSRAIEWARDQKVDIISMSFAIQDKDAVLEEKVKDAFTDGIVQLCSTHDEGSNVRTAWPAGWETTITVAACDEYGSLHHRAPPGDSDYRYKVNGIDVPAGVVPFLNSNDKISGSSVATAIVADLSSLILSCDRLANPGRVHNKSSKGRIVKSHLDRMAADTPPNGHGHYLLLERFGGMHEKGDDLSISCLLNPFIE